MGDRTLIKRAARRLDDLINQVRYVTASQLAERMGLTSPRAVSHWRRGAFPFTRVNEVAAQIGISADYFLDNDELFADRGIDYYLPGDNKKSPLLRRISLDGYSTLMLALLMKANQGELSTRDFCRINSYNGDAFATPSTDLETHVDGYQRTVSLQNGLSLGGANATIEPMALRNLEIVLHPDTHLMLPGQRYPCFDDHILKIHGLPLLRILEASRLLPESVHYAGRMPCAESFAMLEKYIEEYRNDLGLLELIFDTIKRFRHYFLQNRHAAIRAEQLLIQFIRANLTSGEARNAILYAIEALSIIGATGIDARRRTSKFLENLVSHDTTDNLMGQVAKISLAFMPHVASPECFSAAKIA